MNKIVWWQDAEPPEPPRDRRAAIIPIVLAVAFWLAIYWLFS